MATDKRVPPPSWINREFIQSALRNTERKKVTVDSMNVQYANPAGVGYGSLIFRLTASFRCEDNEETHKRTLIVKTVLASGSIKDEIEKIDVFKTEGEMLHDVMSQVHEQLAALEGEEFRPITAKCYQWGRQPEAHLVLEDLSASGFRTAQAGQLLDLKHCRVVLRAYARLHAATAYLLSKQPHYKDVFTEHLCTNKHSLQLLGKTSEKCFTVLAEELEKCPGYEQYSERYRAYAERFLDVTYERMVEAKKKTKLPVLTHGDCWKNNMMFKYVDGVVSEVRLVDFQFSSVTTPASDLTYFLYSNANEELHRHHLDDLLSEYHSTLVGLLRRLGMEQQAEAYTLDELHNDMDHCLVVGAIFGTGSGIFLTSEENGAEYEKAFDGPKQMEETVRKSFRNPYSLPYLKYLTPIFARKGLI